MLNSLLNKCPKIKHLTAPKHLKGSVYAYIYLIHFVFLWHAEFSSTWRPLSTLTEGICSVSAGYSNQIRATLSGRKHLFWNSSNVCFSSVWCCIKMSFPSIRVRVLILVERTFLDWICAISILRWQIWVAAISPMQTCAAQTWRELTYLEPTWMWVDQNMFLISSSSSVWTNIKPCFLTFLLVFQGANLQGVKMLCSNAEGASLKGCNFEDPSGLKANLEGKTAACRSHCLAL